MAIFVVVSLGQLAANGADSRARRAARSSDQSGFTRAYPSAVVVLVATLIIAGILIVISTPNALLHAAIVFLFLVTLGYRRQDGPQQ